MSRSFEEALINRRSYYAIKKNETPISDLEIEHIVHTAVQNMFHQRLIRSQPDWYYCWEITIESCGV